jgi:hypothetical protein
MPSLPFRSGIPLFGRMLHHSSVSAEIPAAAVRSSGLGRSVGRRVSAPPCMEASTVERWRIVGTAVCRTALVTMLVTMTNVAAMAQAATSVAPLQHHAINDPIADFIAEASRRFGVPAAWIRVVMRAESAGDARAVSSAGAMGLMQIMPNTWAELRARYGLGADPFDARDNIHAGAAYLRELHDRYGAPGFLAAYHAGPGRYDDHLANGRPLPVETDAYLAEVIPAIDAGSPDDRLVATDPLAWTQAPLFVARGRGGSAGEPASGQRPIDRTSSEGSSNSMAVLASRSDGLFVQRASRSRQP